MKPGAQGFFKRPCLRVSCGNNPEDASWPADISTGLLQTLHDFQYVRAYSRPCYMHLDGQALSMFRTVRLAVKEWLAESRGNIPNLDSKHCEFLEQKLLFASSDILRDASARMRMAQALESQSKVALPAQRDARRHVPPTAGYSLWFIMKAIFRFTENFSL